MGPRVSDELSVRVELTEFVNRSGGFAALFANEDQILRLIGNLDAIAHTPYLLYCPSRQSGSGQAFGALKITVTGVRPKPAQVLYRGAIAISGGSGGRR